MSRLRFLVPVPAAVGVDSSQHGTSMLVDGGQRRRVNSTPTDGYFTRHELSSPIMLLERSQLGIRTSITAWLAGWLAGFRFCLELAKRIVLPNE